MHARSRRRIWLFAMIILFSAQNPADTFGSCATAQIAAASPSYDDVVDAMAKARPGDSVIVPEGQATWDHQLVITKGIRLLGAGIGKTVITGSYNAVGSRLAATSYLVVYRPSKPQANEAFRLSGFTFNPSAKAHGLMLENRTLKVMNRVRVDHIRIENCLESRTMSIHGTVFGVADNNEFVGCYVSIDGLDAPTWESLAFRFGSADNFYFEDNLFVGITRLVMRSEMGAIWCARFNKWDASQVKTGLFPLFDMHGNIPRAHNAVMGVEIYGNTVIEPGHGLCLLDQRGGMALVFDNDIRSAGTVSTKVREEFDDALNPPAVSPVTREPQHVSNSYYWRNLKNGSRLINPFVAKSLIDHHTNRLVPEANVDFWSEDPRFDGRSGMGVGLLDKRPGTCTKGVAYWATDRKTLFVCGTGDTWEAFYSPFAYPHPLRTEGSN